MKHFLLVINILFLNSLLYAQYTNIRVSNINQPNEPSICMDPMHPDIVVIGSNLNYFYYSSNEGYDWTRGILTSTLYGVWGDPCIVVDTNSIFYYFHLSHPPGVPWVWVDRIVCQKSTDNGMTWQDPGSYPFTVTGSQQDKEWACVDRTNNNIYVTWTYFDKIFSTNPNDSSRIMFAKSTNGGDNWLEVKRISRWAGDALDDDNTMEGAVPCTGPNGEVYVSWAGPKIWYQKWGIFFNKSTDEGATFLTDELYVGDQRGGWFSPIMGYLARLGLPVTCCDVSNGPYRGNIYINYTDSTGTNDNDVWIVKSTNGGNNWSAPIRVNDDPPGKQQINSWMTIDQANGDIYVIFYDRRNYTNNNTDVYVARSTDGGDSFQNFKVSSTPFVPLGNSFFGDYINISAHNKKVIPVWTRDDANTTSVWIALMDFSIGIKKISSEIPAEFKLFQNYPNPFNPSTKIKFSIPPSPAFSKGEGLEVRLVIYDILGHTVAEPVNTKLQPGMYEAAFDVSNLIGQRPASGIYFYSLETEKHKQTKKMIILK
jgi:hypothetical protein